MEPTTFPIGELSRRTGIPSSTLRYWDDLRILIPRTRQGGQRRYTDDHVHRVGVIVACQRAGFSLAEIDELLDAPPARRRRLTRAKIAHLERRIHDAARARVVLTDSLRCDCLSLATCGLLEAVGHERPGHSRP
ncbi:MAG: MerR family transcriptional regulator [Acidimicrobiales bacterium]